MNRRDLIKSAALLVATRALSTKAQASVRVPPHSPLTVKSSSLQVVFDPEAGLPYTYTYAGKRILGEDTGQPATAIVCQLEPRLYQSVPVRVVSVKQRDAGVAFTFQAAFGNVPAATFQLNYTLDGASLVLTMESVTEHAGFELIELALPRLMTVREEDGPAWMAEGRNGGSFVRLEEAKAYRFPDNQYFGRISTELPIGMVGQSGIGCVMEVTAFMDGTETVITGTAGSRRAAIGNVMVYRVDGGRCYDMNDNGPPICGNQHTPNLLAEQLPRTRFNFFACADQQQPWMTGAKIIRARVPSTPTTYFSDKFLYIVAGRNKTAPKPRTTFAQSRQLVHDIALLTDNAPQIALISGWVYDGQDTGFPSEDKVNSSLGTYDDLLALMAAGRTINANITVNVNYDDAYKSSPLFNDAFIARRPDGAIWASRAWDGETSYVVGMAKYMEGGWGSKRINYTMDRYGIRDAILIDAMSWFAVRNDWDPKHPASGYKNLVGGKYKIVDQFRARGVHVTSEQLRYPFIGKLAVTMNGPGVSKCPFGGEAVPLLPTIYRGAAIWGSNGDGKVHPQQEIFWNTRSALWFDAATDRSMIADFYYLVVLPFSKLHRLTVEDYQSSGSIRRLSLEENSHVEIDTASKSYAAVIRGVEIARDDSVSCPIDGHRIAFYARSARTLQYPLPKDWDASAVTARTLSLQGRSACKVSCSGGLISLDVQAGQPVIVYAGAADIPA